MRSATLPVWGPPTSITAPGPSQFAPRHRVGRHRRAPGLCQDVHQVFVHRHPEIKPGQREEPLGHSRIQPPTTTRVAHKKIRPTRTASTSGGDQAGQPCRHLGNVDRLEPGSSTGDGRQQALRREDPHHQVGELGGPLDGPGSAGVDRDLRAGQRASVVAQRVGVDADDGDMEQVGVAGGGHQPVGHRHVLRPNSVVSARTITSTLAQASAIPSPVVSSPVTHSISGAALSGRCRRLRIRTSAPAASSRTSAATKVPVPPVTRTVLATRSPHAVCAPVGSRGAGSVRTARRRRSDLAYAAETFEYQAFSKCRMSAGYTIA